jgi:sialate O-acetylesterase
MPLTAGGPFTMGIKGDNEVTIRNLFVGEVWVCSGQSNMQMALAGASTGKTAILHANHPQIRFFSVPRKTSVKPLTDAQGIWSECTPETARHFSAVAYFFGRNLHQKLDVPIGLIHSSWGGTPAEAWTSIEALRSDPKFNKHVAAANRNLASHPAAAAAYPAKLAAYEAKANAWNSAGGKEYLKRLSTWQWQVAAARQQGKPLPKRPVPHEPQPVAPIPPDGTSKTPTVLYNAMIAPLVPYAIKGVIWYQGESNAKDHAQYRSLFPAMITDWRKKWRQGDFPFLFVQIAPFNGIGPEIREAQLLAWSRTPVTAMVVTTDVGDATNIHPARKEPVGQRLALAARALAYGEKIEYSGPLYQAMAVDSGKAVLGFSHVGGGLVAKNGDLKGFTIAGADGNFVPGKAEIDGDQVVVSSPDVASPTAVRYGWENFPQVNLFNREGLPASPFRTDVK